MVKVPKKKEKKRKSKAGYMSKNGVYSIDVVIEKMVEGKKKVTKLKI